MTAAAAYGFAHLVGLAVRLLRPALPTIRRPLQSSNHQRNT